MKFGWSFDTNENFKDNFCGVNVWNEGNRHVASVANEIEVVTFEVCEL